MREMIARRHALMIAAAALSSLPAQSRTTPSGLWFDPTQLPSYSGRLERWIATPSGNIDRGLFREGTQFVFPASEAEALMQAIEPGGPICVWGIRARAAPVVLMLAWAKADNEPASFVERPAWFVAHEAGRERMQLQGRIQAPLLTPQGEGMGVILADGAAIRLPVEVHRSLGDALDAGGTMAAEGLGSRRGPLAALDAERIGKDLANLRPVPAP
jgi:hypothetical protein